MKLILLLILKLSAVCSGSHSLKYYITGVSSPGSGLPVYSVVGYLDDWEIENYNSDTRQYLPKTEWMKKLEPDYWERGTTLNQKQEPIFKQNVQIAMSRFNQTEGFHIFQSMHGCMLDDDGTVLGYEQIGYDGRDFMYLDTQNGIWIPTVYAAEITTQRWNSPEESQGNKNKIYLENECIETLKNVIQLGRNDMSRVPPMVKVSAGHKLGEVTKLHCQVYGFYPQAVTVRWIKNGIDTIDENQANHILPNPDGTYQTTLSIEVQVREVDTYSCHVDHSSLQETVIILWGYKAHKDQNSHGDSNHNIGLIVGLLAAAFIIVLALFIWKRRSVIIFVQQAAGHCSILPSFLWP